MPTGDSNEDKYIKQIKDNHVTIHNMVVANQAAWIEWKHGKGAEAAMKWIQNGLLYPGHIPDGNSPRCTDAQAYFDANVLDYDKDVGLS